MRTPVLAAVAQPVASSDEEARERATDPARSVLLQAPAGSGKTTVLTERLLRLLAVVERPEEILAITFTRKAAAEMRARVLQALRGESPARSPQEQRVCKLAAAALARAEERGWQLQQDPGRLRIQTIDSFNFRLASQLTLSARAGGTLQVTERAAQLYRRAAGEALAEADRDPQLAADVGLLFDRLDNRWQRVQQLLADMLQRRGHWLRYVLSGDPDSLCARVSESLRNIAADHLEAASRALPAVLRAQAAQLPGMGPLTARPEDLGRWQQLSKLLLTRTGEWRKPNGLNKSLGAGFESRAGKEALRALLAQLDELPAARQSLVEIYNLPGYELCGADASALQALARMLRAAAGHLQLEFAASGRVDHTFVAGAARAALTEESLPTDLALRTGLSLRHILVDEFQDTSLAQFDLLQALTAGWEPGDGRTLFIVGDPMQSIYQFREAEVGLFLRARAHGIGARALEPLQLRRNFRSVRALIEWNNRVFTRLFPAADNLRESAVAFTASMAGRTAAAAASALPAQADLFSASPPAAPPPASILLFDDARPGAEMDAIVDRILELRRADVTATIAVLVAARTHAAPIIAALEQHEVDTVGVELVALQELSIIRDLVALARALLHPGDRTAWLAVLRAPWCGASLHSLSLLSRRGDPRLVWEALQDEACLERCMPEDCSRLRRVRAVFAAALAAVDLYPLTEWLERTWLQLGAADCYEARDLRHARAFFTALGEFVSGGEWRDVEDLERLVADLYAQPQPSTANPVQIMTIHKAKGLEFDHVLVPALGRQLNRGQEPLLRWLDLPRGTGGSDLVMAPMPAIGDDNGGEVTAFLKRLMRQRTLNEQQRLLYVAATRARRTLVLSGTLENRADGEPRPRGGTLLDALWPLPAMPEVSYLMSASAEAEKTVLAPSKLALQRLRQPWSQPVLEAAPAIEPLPLARRDLAPPEFSWVGETRRHIGTVVHGALEALARESVLPSPAEIETRAPRYAALLRWHGVPEADLARGTRDVVEALSRTLTHERGRWLFSSTHREAASELALTGLAEGRLTQIIIDRSFIDRQGTRWVVDFKTSRHEGGGRKQFLQQEMERYRTQLRTYVSLAKALGPEPVRAALYFPLLGEFLQLDD